MTIALRLLGGASFGGTDISSRRMRALLALLVEEPAGVSASSLAEQIWDDGRPANPGKALQVLVSRARSQFGSGVIANTAAGYRLGLPSDQVDVHLARRRERESAEALEGGRPSEALDAADDGLQLWGHADGDPVAAHGDLEPALARVRAAAQTARRDLRRSRGLALGELGRHSLAMPALLELASEHPRDEEVLAALLRSEARVVSRAAALDRYERYRRSLREQLGLDPGTALQDLQAELLGDDREARHGIRHEPNPLLGREADIAELSALLRTSRVVSIVGAGGLGKTRLAHVLGREADQRIVHFVELAGVATSDGVAPEVGAEVGVRESMLRLRPGGRAVRPADLMTGLVEVLGAAPALLVLDNCEHVVQGAADLVDALVGRCPRLTVLTTTRIPLGLTSETAYPLPQLDGPTSSELFVQRARAARPGVELLPDLVDRLCAQLDGLPLAIELAAARTRVMSVAEVERRLADRFALLRGGSRTAPERHQTLEAVIDWSWNLLTPDEQDALRVLSAFQDGFGLEAAEAMLGPADALVIVESLAGQSLLTVTEPPIGDPEAFRQVRYRMLETVREFGMKQLDVAHETQLADRRLRAWGRSVAVAWGPRVFGPEVYAALDCLRLEEGNLDHILRLAIADGDAVTAATLFSALGSAWSVESNHGRVLSLVDELLPLLVALRPEPAELEPARLALAVMAGNCLIASLRSASRAIIELRRLPPGDPDTPGSAIALLVEAARSLIRGETARLDELAQNPNPIVSLSANALASQIWENRCDLAAAERHARRGLELSSDSPWGQASAHARLAELAMQKEDLRGAEHHAMQALPGLERIGAWPDVVQLRGLRLLARLASGDLEGAQLMLPDTELLEAQDFPFGASVVHQTCAAEIALARGEVDRGLALYLAALDFLRSTPSPLPPESFGFEPWSLYAEATVVAAHARHHRPDDVSALAAGLEAKVMALLARADPTVDFPICGTVLLGLALHTLASAPAGDVEASLRGIHLLALAQRFAAKRSHPVLFLAPAAERARAAGHTAYDEAVEEYAGLELDELAAVALRVLTDVR